MKVSCLLPTYNRFPSIGYIVEEALQSFLQQTHDDKELIILNDTPGQSLSFNHPQVRVINASYRFPTLGEKLHWMLEQAQGEYICRWDDDDISLPWRLSKSVAMLNGGKEWRPENHWYFPKGGPMSQTKYPGNTHIMAIWHRDIILDTSVKYPGRYCASGYEDQTFNQHLRSLGYPQYGTLLPLEEIFYLYRWGIQPNHLSGKGGGDKMQQTYDSLANESIAKVEFDIKPRWQADYVELARRSAKSLPAN